MIRFLPQTAGRKDITESTPIRNSRKINNRISQLEQTSKVPESWLSELNTQIHFLIEEISIASKLVELSSGHVHNKTTLRVHENKLDERTHAGDIERYEQNLENLMSDYASRRNKNYISSQYEHKTTSDVSKPTEMLKKSLKRVLETAHRIKSILPLIFQEKEYKNPILSALPTGAVETPTTQTEPINTYVEYLQVTDRASKSNAKNSYSQKHSSPRNKFGIRSKASNRTRTVDSAHPSGDIYIKQNSRGFDSRNIHLPLHSTPNDPSTGKIIRNVFSKKKPDYVESTIDRVEWSLPSVELEENDSRQQQYFSQMEKIPKKEPKADRMTKSSSIDFLTSELDREQFSLADYMSAMRQVRKRSPPARTEGKSSRTSVHHFDFDDYYEKLINLRSSCKPINEPTITDVAN
ncbi:uncharacterized protein NPIL_190111 [Nephila pilipes]|uniref:Uncharacterized protein n=1 Tax=Nephila pilipes TaxID=299642 RepID=A0A8X6QZI0_NEPPI|nr:uncharacterized protein NPIL_190111 [Nephila pilipes]